MNFINPIWIQRKNGYDNVDDGDNENDLDEIPIKAVVCGAILLCVLFVQIFLVLVSTTTEQDSYHHAYFIRHVKIAEVMYFPEIMALIPSNVFGHLNACFWCSVSVQKMNHYKWKILPTITYEQFDQSLIPGMHIISSSFP